MKVVYPKHIQKGMLAGMTFQIGPISLSIVQLFVVAIGVAGAMAIFNTFSKSGGELVGIVLAICVLLVFILIAFFKISELALIPFIAKLIRNNFFDAKRKFQVNYDRMDPIKLLIKKYKTEEEKQVIEYKENTLSKETLEKMNKGGFM
jgi:hypothetical protein